MSIFERLGEPKAEKQEQQPFDLEQWLASELKSQYEAKARILNRLGLLEILPQKQEIGILGIDGREYPFPEPEAIERELRKNKELFETKMAQGFTELEIIPFALPLNRLIDSLRKQLFKHHKEGKLFQTKKNQADQAEEFKPFDLDENNPLYVWDQYENADESGKLAYNIKEFSQNHEGKTKREMIEALNRTALPGFLVILREKNMNIPREGKGETKNGRKQLEANKTSKEYLKMFLTEKQYEGESGQTPEEWLTEFLTQIEQTNQVIDDWQGNGSATYQVGAYFPASGYVPDGYSDRGYRRAYLGGSYPVYRRGGYGARSAVRVGQLEI